ncbi:unnamed protein product [Medioppia subpectinata]|uniref:Uncharacterized protein n=1 Tax=Medioppia subpectinata TaxID=1979941 RepID=A0A7R9QFT3_9ACAR|nr:unnamed protein product [Medioppia subpectinata]CAG2119902.1 unnamed protein product [Medioppia subpectinata]
MAAKRKTHNKTATSDREVVVGEDVVADNGLVEGEGVVARSPILVHCSAGVGRSGTFIAVDRIMEMLKHCPDSGGGVQVPKDLTIDVFNTVCDMRRCRPNMVQTEDQYIYIYDCIKYFIDRLEGQTAGPTDVTDTSLCDIIEKGNYHFIKSFD